MTDCAEQVEKTPRLMIFVDFWNYELTMKELDPAFLTNWFKLPEAITNAVSQLLGRPIDYERCFIFGSYDPSSTGDTRLRTWASKVLSKVKGVQASFVPRQKRTKGPTCSGAEHHEVTVCPICQSSMLGTQEKGVDTQIAIEMLDMAYSDRCDIIVLLSADKDFVPAVKKLIDRNIKVINAYFPNHGHELSGQCWASFDLFNIRDHFQR